MNEITLQKMSQMKLFGMQKAFQSILESKQYHVLNNDELMALLLQAEWEERENKKIKRYLHMAHFRYQASIEEINFTQPRNLEKTQLLRFADCNYIERGENILVSGPTGVGKSFVSSALGNQACIKGFRVLYFNTQKLFAQLKMSKADGSYIREMNKIERSDLVIIDDFGLQPLDNQNRITLIEIIEDRHGKKSTIISSQLPVSQWYEIIGESTIADAIMDRLVHTAHRIELKGESMRKKI
jgi:DNA replication protein DnaC